MTHRGAAKLAGHTAARSNAHLLARPRVSKVADELEVAAAALCGVTTVLLVGAMARGGPQFGIVVQTVATKAADGGGASLARELEAAVHADVRAQQAAELEQWRTSLRVAHHCGA